MIPLLVEKALADACHQSNPRPCGADDFLRLIERSF
jgi:alcohol dehydrogenase class IV